MVFCSRERKASSAPAGSPARTAVPGFSPLAARAVPESSPPPPTGATTASRSGIFSISSRQAVPWPAIMRGSL